MVPALRMQRAVNQKVGVMSFKCFALFSGFALDHGRTQDQVGYDHRLAAVVESQDIGGALFSPVLVVQGPALGFINDANRDFSWTLQGMCDPARHPGWNRRWAPG